MRTTGRTADSDSGPPAFPNRAHRLPPRKGLEADSSLAVGEGASGDGGLSVVLPVFFLVFLSVLRGLVPGCMSLYEDVT